MAWTTPKTWAAGTAVLEGQLNIHLRDNLLQTMPGRATTAGQFFVATGLNAIAPRSITASTVATSQSTLSADYTDLTTVGPSVSVTTGTRALVIFMARISTTTVAPFFFAGGAYMSVTSSTIFADEVLDLYGIYQNSGRAADAPFRAMSAKLFTTLTPGANTFTCKYRVDGLAQGNFSDRTLIVVPL